jgi:Ricin-type beta-trefoil lectin domain-like
MRMRWLAALLFAGGLAAGLGAGMTGTAHASGPTRAGEAWHEIRLPFDNAMCVDVPGGSTAAGARLQLSRCHGYASTGAPQQWIFSGGRFHQMSNANSGLCIGFPGGGPPVTGARLVQERCDQVAAWQLVPLSRDGADPLVQLETGGSGGPALCMAAASLSDRNHTPLVTLPCDGFQDAAQILELG